MSRVILHVDANSFYASVECLYRPELRGKAVSVCGDPEARHGIVLTSTIPAKRRGVRTGMALWQARQVCPELITVPANYPLYVHFSRMMRAIEEEWSDRVESFGLDENWLDVSRPGTGLPEGERIAHAIRCRIRDELGITVSVGVSWNKVLAKLGSDMKKPDAVTVIDEAALRERVWPLPAGELLYVGPATRRRLTRLGIRTIGQLAAAPAEALRGALGKNGLMLKAFAMGIDEAPVRRSAEEDMIKSVGNSATAPHDITTGEEARCMCYLLAECVAARLREHGFRGRCVSLSARDAELIWSSRQTMLPRAVCSADDIARAGLALFEASFRESLPLRSLGISVSALAPMDAPRQLDMLGEAQAAERRERMDTALDGLRRRFGHQSVTRGIVLTDRAFFEVNPREEHTIHPVAFLR